MTDALNEHVTLMSVFAAPAGMSQIYDLGHDMSPYKDFCASDPHPSDGGGRV